jgi:Lar family restriction alleviation protein
MLVRASTPVNELTTSPLGFYRAKISVECSRTPGILVFCRSKEISDMALAKVESYSKDKTEEVELDLLPCPFCGGSDLSVRRDYTPEDPSHWYAMHIFCEDCHAHGRNNFPIGWCECEQSAADGWNLRGHRRGTMVSDSAVSVRIVARDGEAAAGLPPSSAVNGVLAFGS